MSVHKGPKTPAADEISGGTRIAPPVGVLRLTEDVIRHPAHGSKEESSRRRSRRPQLPSLLISDDHLLVRSIRRVAQREEIPLDACEDSAAALDVISGKPYQAVLVDFDMPGIGQVLKSVSRQREKPVTLALVASGTLLGAAFDAGAALVIHKPAASDSVRLGLKAAYSVGGRQGRKLSRRSAHLPCRLGVPGARVLPGEVVNLGEGGACVSTDSCMSPGTFLTLRFSMPGTKSVFDLGAVAVWNDGERRTGLRFQRMHYRHAGRIRSWVQGSDAA